MRVVTILGLCSLALPAASQTTSANPDVAAFIVDMAQKHRMDRETLAQEFDGVRFRNRIIELMDKQSKRLPWTDYRSRFVNEAKLSRGLRFWQDQEAALELARRRYGVPPEIIVAILGVETHYGKNKGSFGVLEALTTLAFQYPKRAELFRLELEHFLLLAMEEPLPLREPVGSYAGAMGIAQFMPGSYRRYAVDFDGDGRRDLFANEADAIGSVANYLTAYGWQRGAPVAVPATLDARAKPTFDEAELTTRIPLETLRESGVSAVGAFESSLAAIPLTLWNGDSSEFWLGFENFYVITRYNHSTYYAMAVFQLSQELLALRSPPRAGEP